MTKQQVIEALLICASDNGCCGCPYRHAYDGAECTNAMMKAAAACLTDSTTECLTAPTEKRNTTEKTKPQPEVKKGRHSKGGRKRAVLMLDNAGKILQRFRSVAEAGRACGRQPTQISACCNGGAHTAAGYWWKYADE